MKKFLCIFFMTIIACLTINGCSHGYYGSVHLQDSHITFYIKDISFQESNLWENYKNEGVNYLNLCMFVADTTDDEQNINMDLENKDNKNVNLSITFDYDNQPTAKFDNTLYDLDGSSDCDHSILQVTSVLQSVNEYTISEDEKNKSNISSHHVELKNNSLSAIYLKYSIDNESAIDFELTGEEIEKGKDSDIFNYDVEYEVVHEGESLLPKLNLIVMAEGYTKDQMEWYKEYVADAFKDAAGFHETTENYEPITNDFFDYYWEQIRVIRMDTISPQSGVDQESGVDRIQSILDYHVAKGENHFCDFHRIEQIMSNYYSKNNYEDADAIIVFVNDKNCASYTTPYDNEFTFKYGQPVNVVIIQAPVGEQFFYIFTYSIAHELGHALARLQDEYDDNRNDVTFEYKSKYRNISSSDTNVKWQKMIDAGYGGGTKDNFLLETYEGCLYTKKGLYRPTYTSTMRQTDYKDNVQFGPVNTYHLVASFKIRTMNCDNNIPDLVCDEDPAHYEWKHYSIEQFLDEWKPEKFK